MRTLTVIAAFAFAWTLLGPPGTATARANFYMCHDADGRIWIRNFRVHGQRCRLVMRTGDSGPRKHVNSGGHGSGDHHRREFTPPSLGGVPHAVNEPGGARDRMSLYAPYIEEASRLYQIPEAFIRAVIRVESNFHAHATSPVGAQGLMQLMPATARHMGVDDAYDSRQNILGGTRFLRILANKYDGDMVKVLSAYNAGSGAVAAKGGIPYQDTEGYVRAVLDYYYQYKAMSDER